MEYASNSLKRNIMYYNIEYVITCQEGLTQLVESGTREVESGA